MPNLAENNLILFPGRESVPQTSLKSVHSDSVLNFGKAYSKSHVGYWKKKVYQPRGRRSGSEKKSADYCIKIQHGCRRHTFCLNTAEISEAASIARDIYMSVLSDGWDETLLKFRPGWNVRRHVVTFGDYFDELENYSTFRPRMIALYQSKVFRLLAGVAQIKGMRGWKARCARAREDWLRKLGAIKLVDIQDHQIIQWQTMEIRKVESDPVKRISRVRTLNTNLRTLKSIFSQKHLQRLSHLSLPDTLPGRNVAYLPDRPNRYRSSIDAEVLAKNAVESFIDSDQEVLKAFFLSLFCGLRKSESDLLLWRSFDWSSNRICVEPHEYHDLKTVSSEGFHEKLICLKVKNSFLSICLVFKLWRL